MSAPGVPQPKQYLHLAGRTLIGHTLAALAGVARIERIVVVISPGDCWWSDADYEDIADRLLVLRCGGDTRAQTVANGLAALRGAGYGDACRVLVHDAARPCLRGALVERLIDEVADDEAGGLLAIPVADTLKRAPQTGTARSLGTLARDGLWQAQTPQMFPLGRLAEALAQTPNVTDEASAMEAAGFQPRLVSADAGNLKVTFPHDLVLAESILNRQTSGKTVP